MAAQACLCKVEAHVGVLQVLVDLCISGDSDGLQGAAVLHHSMYLSLSHFIPKVGVTKKPGN